MNDEQEIEIIELIDYLELKTRQASDPVVRENARRAWDSLVALRNERDSLRAFKRGVDEALNSGDGSYRP